jgi:hypothetical protein
MESLYSSCFLANGSAAYGILGWKSFSFGILKAPPHHLLASKSDWKSKVIPVLSVEPIFSLVPVI